MMSVKGYKRTSHNFFERQKITNLLLFAVLLFIEAIFVSVTMEHILANRPWGIKTLNSWIWVVLTLMIPTPLILAALFARFETVINEDGIFYRWNPFRKSYRMILWENVKEISIIDLKSAGFWWRFSSKYGEVQYLGGGYGIQIKMKSGRRRLLGTQKAEELNRLLIRIAGDKYQPSNVGRYFDFE